MTAKWSAIKQKLGVTDPVLHRQQMRTRLFEWVVGATGEIVLTDHLAVLDEWDLMEERSKALTLALTRSVEEHGLCWDCGRIVGHLPECQTGALLAETA